jgi:hypothetical protein
MTIRRALAYILVTALHPLIWSADLLAGVRPRARLRTAYREVRTLFP